MFSKLLLSLCLIVPAAAFAQNQPTPGAQMQQPATTVNVVPPQSPSVVVVGGGLYGTAVYPLSYLPMAPSQNTAPQQAGTAGISFLSPSTYSGPGYSYATPIYSSNPASPYYNATPVNPAPPATVAETGPAVIDFGPSYYVSDSATVAAASTQPSLAEIAAHYRTSAKRAARMYTNADAWRLSGGEVIPGIIAANMPPSAPPEESQQPSQSQPQPSANQTNQPSNPSQPPAPAATTPAQSPTQPQAAPPQSKPPEESGKKSTLPATSTLLPLFGALGFLSGAVGLWIARHRR